MQRRIKFGLTIQSVQTASLSTRLIEKGLVVYSCMHVDQTNDYKALTKAVRHRYQSMAYGFIMQTKSETTL